MLTVQTWRGDFLDHCRPAAGMIAFIGMVKRPGEGLAFNSALMGMQCAPEGKRPS